MLALVLLSASFAQAADGQMKAGTIKSVDLQAKSFVLSREPSPMTFSVTDKTVVTLDGKESTLEAAMKLDLKASVTYSKDGLRFPLPIHSHITLTEPEPR